MVKGGVAVREPKELNIQLGSRIRKARETAGLTQDTFAEMIKTESKNLSAIERGMVGISLSTMKRICETLFISSDMLLMDGPRELDAEIPDLFTERLKRLSPRQFGLMMEINNKLFEAFSLQQSDIE